MRKRHNKRNLKIQEARKLQKPPTNMVPELDRKKPILETTRESCSCSCIQSGGGDTGEIPGSAYLYTPIINSINCGAGLLPYGSCDTDGVCNCQCLDNPASAPNNAANTNVPGAYVNRDNPSTCSCEGWVEVPSGTTNVNDLNGYRQLVWFETVNMGLNFCPQGVVYDQWHGGLVGRTYWNWSVDPVFNYITSCEGTITSNGIQEFHADFYPQYWGQECVTAVSWDCDSDWPSGDECHCSCSNGQYSGDLHSLGFGGGDCDSNAECEPHCHAWCSTFNPYTEMWACIHLGMQDLDGDGLIEGWAEMSPPGICPHEEHGCKQVCESSPHWQTILNSVSGDIFTFPPNVPQSNPAAAGPGYTTPIVGPGVPFMVSGCFSGTGNIDISGGGAIN